MSATKKENGRGEPQERRARQSVVCLLEGSQFPSLKEQASRVLSSLEGLEPRADEIWRPGLPALYLRMPIGADEIPLAERNLTSHELEPWGGLLFDEKAFAALTASQCVAFEMIYTMACHYGLYVCDGEKEPIRRWVALKTDKMDEFLSEYVRRSAIAGKQGVHPIEELERWVDETR